MNKKILILLLLVIFIVISIFIYLVMETKQKEISQQIELQIQEKKEYYTDAPRPDMDPEEIFKLWPDLQKQEKLNPEEIDRQWREFAKKYPDNFYIPTKYLNLTEKQKEERQRQLETFASLESKYASLKAKLEKESKEGINGPETIKEESTVDPEEQSIYFQYKIKELQSRIELIEYWLENDSMNIDEEQKKIASQDLEEWKKELEIYKNLLKEIPTN